MARRPHWKIDFWKPDTEDQMNKTYWRLIELGMTPEEAEDRLRELYFSVAEEYGD